MTKDFKEPSGELMLRVSCGHDTKNFQHGVFGGWIFGQMDIGATILCKMHSKAMIVTRAVNNFLFHKPARVGDILEVYATLKKVGNTSLTTEVEAWAINIDKKELIATGEIIFVSVDENYNPIPADPQKR